MTDELSATRSDSQGGYILTSILGLMALSTILLVALLAVTQSTVRIEQTGKIRERQARAAESAVQVAINQIRNSDTIATANPLNRKQYGDPGYLTGQPSYKQPIAEQGDARYTLLGDPNINRAAAGGVCIPPSQLINVDGFPVRVFCYPEELSQYDQNGTVVNGVPQDDGAPAVRLVGDTYMGDTSYPGLTDVAANWKTTFPFSGAMTGFNQGEINATKGQLLYTGSTPLRIVGGLQVRNQIAAVSSGNGPALEVQGAARQGGKGMFDSGSGPLDCGIAKNNDTYSSPKADIKINSLFVPVSEGLNCNQADMASMAQTGATSPNGEWDNDRVQRNRYNKDWQEDYNPSNPAIPYTYYLNNANVPTDCDLLLNSVTHQPSKRISVAAGAYDARATAQLNKFWGPSDKGGCDNRTWIFEGGDYWFDVNDTSPVTAALPANDPSRHSLVFNNRTVNWVFGPSRNSPVLNPNFPPTDAPWSVENFPEACDRSFASPADGSRGTSITLSSRTGVFHRAGRVAICGPIGVKPADWDASYPQTTSQSTAIFQRPSTPLGARLLPTGLTAGDFSAGSAPLTAGTIQADDGQQIQMKQSVPPGWWDSGTATFSKTFTATGFGSGSPNTSGPDAVNSIWVDVTGSGDRVNGDQTSTRLEVTLPDGTTCWTQYGPSPNEARRLPSNNTVTSYNLLDTSASGNCASALGSKTRDKLYGANIKVTFTMNPPKMRNTQFSWWDWWPWWRDHVVIPACNLLNASIDWFNYTIWDIINWYAKCDDRPSTVSYSVNSIVLRLGWSPNLGVPVDGNVTAPPWNNIPVQNPGNATKANAGTATISMPTGFPNTSSFSTLRYEVSDPTLLDGFLPLQTLNFGYKIARTGFDVNGGADDNDNNVVQFTLKQNVNDGIWCRKTVRLQGMNGSVQDSGALKPSAGVTLRGDGEVLNGCIKKVGLGPMNLAGGSTVATDVEIGQFISHYDHPVGGNLQPAFLDVDVRMAYRGTSKTVSVDYVTVSATAGEMKDGNLVGYPRPLNPFTVTWSPLTPNPDGDAAIGDASFNVWGSVSVPNNDVRVIWNYDQTRYAGQLGFPIFNSGKQPYQRCNPQGESQCQPALVAAALGSWTTMTNNGYPVTGSWPALSPGRAPDPLASTGNVRLPVRSVRFEACVVDSTGSGLNGDLLPRVMAQVRIADRDGQAGAIVTGAKVWTTQWQSRRDPAFEPAADALTNDCATSQ